MMVFNAENFEQKNNAENLTNGKRFQDFKSRIQNLNGKSYSINAVTP